MPVAVLPPSSMVARKVCASVMELSPAGRAIEGWRLVEAELVALDVLHHQARFVLLVGREQAQTSSADRFQPSRFSLERGYPRVTRQPHADADIKMQPVLHGLGFRHPL